MKLNHLNLTVDDVAGARDFLTEYFDLQVLPWGDEKMAFLKDENGMILSLMAAPGSAGVTYPGMFHIGFMQDSRAKVDALNSRLIAADLSVKPAREFHGSYTFYVKAPGGFTVEVLSE